MNNYRFLVPITGLFVASLLISNTLDTKVFTFLSLNLPAGIILFPIAYVFGDILTEVYGYSASRKVIWTGFVSLIIMVLAYEIARVLPAADFWKNQDSFDQIFSHIPRIVLASIAAFITGEFVNSYIVAKMKVAQKGKGMAWRFLTSTFAGQAVDTTIFVLIAFLGTMPLASLGSIIISAWAFKVVWEIIALPITVLIVTKLKELEQVDHFDTDTNFNPLASS